MRKRFRSSQTSRHTLLSLVVVVMPLVASAAGSTAGCSNYDEFEPFVATVATGSGAGGGDASGGGGPVEPETARELWDAIEGEMLDQCNACHREGGAANTPFLAYEPTPYESITRWPGIVRKDPEDSKLLNYPNNGNHPKELVPELEAKVRVWLTKEAEELPEDILETIETEPQVIYVDGSINVFYLNQFDDNFGGSSITFFATEIEIEDDKHLLLIEDVQVHAPVEKAVHIVHPLFVEYPNKGAPKPDIIDGFSNVEAVLPDPTTGSPTLGSGGLVLANWAPGSRLSIAFAALEIVSDNGSVITDCVALAEFEAAVIPAMTFCANACHDGVGDGYAVIEEHPAQANQAMDLSALASDPAESCKEVRLRIVAGSPDTSPIVVSTSPTGPAGHPYRFEGDNEAHAAFVAAVTPWITQEGQ